MRVQQKGLAVLDQSVGVLEIGFALADGFDLGAAQGDAGLEFLQQEVVVAGGAIDRASRAPAATGSRSFVFCGAVFCGLACTVWLVCRGIGVSLILKHFFHHHGTSAHAAGAASLSPRRNVAG